MHKMQNSCVYVNATNHVNTIDTTYIKDEATSCLQSYIASYNVGMYCNRFKVSNLSEELQKKLLYDYLTLPQSNMTMELISRETKYVTCIFDDSSNVSICFGCAPDVNPEVGV